MHHYVIVRRDIPHGLASAQIIHAAGESALFADALPPGTHAIALTADSEAALASIGRALDTAGIPYAAIVESDAPYEGQLMALGVAPMERTPKLKRLLGRCQLLR